MTTDWLLLGDGDSKPIKQHDAEEAEKIKYACQLLEHMEGEGLQRVIDFIEFEIRTP